MIHFTRFFFVDFLKFSDPVLYFGYGDSITNFDQIALANLLEFCDGSYLMFFYITYYDMFPLVW